MVSKYRSNNSRDGFYRTNPNLGHTPYHDSTGGFLAGHCIGQHPDLFKVAATRNPVMNIASMVTATDIPDWCYVEALGIG